MLFVQLLSRHRKGPQAAYATAWESLLSFDLWQRLVRQHELPHERVRELLALLLLSALGLASATVIPPGPRRQL